MSEAKIPYKIYLSEEEMPRAWYNRPRRHEGEARAPAGPRDRQAHGL